MDSNHLAPKPDQLSDLGKQKKLLVFSVLNISKPANCYSNMGKDHRKENIFTLKRLRLRATMPQPDTGVNILCKFTKTVPLNQLLTGSS